MLRPAIAVSVASAAAALVLHLTGVFGAAQIGGVLPAVFAVLAGIVLIAPHQGQLVLYRVLYGVALLVWATGQAITGLDPGGPFPATGYIVSVIAAPLAAAAGCLMLRGISQAEIWQLSIDELLLGTAISLPVWQFGFGPQLPDGLGWVGGWQAPALAAVIALAALVSGAVLIYLRDLDRHMLLAMAGTVIYAVGGLLWIHAAILGGWSLTGVVLTCAAWPLIGAGLIAYRPRSSTGPEEIYESVAPAETRGMRITTLATFLLLLVSLIALVFDRTPDRSAISLVALAVGVFAVRELVNAQLRRTLLARLHAEATADPLTGLANRRVLAGRMKALSHGDSWCLLTVDLDGFKDVNDLLGHGTGDRLLAAVADRLREAVPADALVSRIGGDEFAVLLPGDIEAGARVGAAIVTAVRQSAADVEGVARVEVSASVGVAAVHGDKPASSPGPAMITLPGAEPLPPGAPYDGGSRRPVPVPAVPPATGAPTVPLQGSPHHPVSRLGSEPVADDVYYAPEAGSDGVLGAGHVRVSLGTPPVAAEPVLITPEVVDPLSALSASSAALRKAKAAGRNRVEIYNAEVAQLRRRRLRVEERLRSAVETGAITVAYQPIVELRHGTVAGCEALARWVDTELGRVDPGEFITVAEQTGLVVALGERVLHETLRNAVAAGLFRRGLRVACNVSPVQLRVPGFDRVVQEAIAAHGVPREQLVIEVTEQVLVEEGQAASTLHRLAALGLTIAIDDFGTGYSALGYLQRLPADILKIDQSLTSSLIAEPRSRAITRAVVDLGRTVGLSVVVEGVDSGQVDDLVRKMGVSFGQGLYYGAAMEAPALAAMADRLRT